jgi:hypothetical protein
MTMSDFEPIEIARQLTILQSNLFKKIDIGEFILRTHVKNKENSRLYDLIDDFNKVCAWVAWELLSVPKKLQKNRFLAFLEIMEVFVNSSHHPHSIVKLSETITVP